MKRKILPILCCLLLLSSSAAAQKKPKPKPKPATTTVEPKDSNTNYFYIVALDKNAAAIVAVRADNGSDSLPPDKLAGFFSDLSRLQSSKATAKYKETRSPSVIIRPDSSLKYGALLDAVKAARTESNFKVSVEVENSFYIQVPKKPDPRTRIRPNPLTLIAALDNENNITLNNEPQGTLSNPDPLTEILKRVFREREVNGVYREGTSDVETTVFLNLPPTVSVADLIKLARVVRMAGSDRIGLDLEEIEIIKEIFESPGIN